jgi:TRAP-type C4-dicarboxylate transport system permease large subunit
MSYCLSAVAGVISPWLIVSKYDEAKSLGLTENLGIIGTDVPPKNKVFVPCSLFFVPYSIPSQTIPSNFYHTKNRQLSN